MATGITIVKTTGRLIFDLERDGETTTRTLDIPFAKDSTAENLQTYVNNVNYAFTKEDTFRTNMIIQPANWRDTNTAEEQWITKGVHYEIVRTSTTPIDPDIEPSPEPSPDTVQGG